MGLLTNVLIAMRDMKLMQLRAESELRRRGKFPPPPLDAETARFSESLMQIPLDLHPTPGDRPAGPSLVMRA
jgi:hypothetical protein